MDDLGILILQGPNQCGDAFLSVRVDLHQGLEDIAVSPLLGHQADQDRQGRLRLGAEPSQRAGDISDIDLFVAPRIQALDQHRDHVRCRPIDVGQDDRRADAKPESPVGEHGTELWSCRDGPGPAPGQESGHVRIAVALKLVEQSLNGQRADPVQGPYHEIVTGFPLVEAAIQGRDGGPRLWPDPAQGADGVIEEDLILPYILDALEGANERRDGRPRRGAELTEGVGRMNTEDLVGTVKDLPERRHGRLTDAGQGPEVVGAQPGTDSKIPMLEELIDQDRGGHLRTRSDTHQRVDRLIPESRLAHGVDQVRGRHPGLGAEAAEHHRRLAALRLGARLVPQDGDPALDRLAAERVQFLAPGRNGQGHPDQPGRQDAAHDDGSAPGSLRLDGRRPQ